MCLYPKMILNKKYRPNKKNGGNTPFFNDIRTLYVPIACGVCYECLKKKGREWAIRLNEEIKEKKNAKFVTLTFSEEELTKLEEVAKSDIKQIKLKRYEKEIDIRNETAKIAVRRYLERVRKRTKKSIRHWLVTELGHEGTERIHLHGLIFTEEPEKIETDWKYGYVHVGDYVNEKTINYITKYIYKNDKDHKEYIPKVLASSGLGARYIKSENAKKNSFKTNETKESYTFKNGTESQLPIYYRNKLYSEEEREKLWLEKLDKKTKWVGGEEISVRNQAEREEEYKLREFYRKKYKKLGYAEPKNQEDEKFKKLNEKVNELSGSNNFDCKDL